MTANTPLLRSDASAENEEAHSYQPRLQDRLAGQTFFLLGAASDITFNIFWLNVEYLREQFGESALTVIGNAQFWGSCSAMVVIFAMTLHSPGAAVSAVKLQCKVMLVLMVYMLALNIVMVLFITLGWRLDLTIIRFAILFNGMATGASQALGGRLAGFMTKVAAAERDASDSERVEAPKHSGGSFTPASSHMGGVGFGIAFPTAIQLLLMPFEMPATLLAVLSYSIGIAVVVLGITSLVCIQRADTFGRVAISGASCLFKDAFKQDTVEVEAGSLPRPFSNFEEWFDAKYRFMALRRLRHVTAESVGLFSNYAAGIYLALLAVRIPAHGIVPLPRQLPTLLIGIANTCDFIGRFCVLRFLQGQESKLSKLFRNFTFIVLILIARILIAFGVLAYSYFSAGIATSNVPIISFYAFGAVIGGSATIGFTQRAQATCMQHSGLNMDKKGGIPCPLAGQVMFLACILGSLAGTYLP